MVCLLSLSLYTPKAQRPGGDQCSGVHMVTPAGPSPLPVMLCDPLGHGIPTALREPTAWGFRQFPDLPSLSQMQLHLTIPATATLGSKDHKLGSTPGSLWPIGPGISASSGLSHHSQEVLCG